MASTSNITSSTNTALLSAGWWWFTPGGPSIQPSTHCRSVLMLLGHRLGTGMLTRVAMKADAARRAERPAGGDGGHRVSL